MNRFKSHEFQHDSLTRDFFSYPETAQRQQQVFALNLSSYAQTLSLCLAVFHKSFLKLSSNLP